jgi:1-acyl-sn-glycerol-3-phosphate acyltransferase
MTQQNLLLPEPDFKIYLGSSLLFIYIFFSMVIFASLIILALILPFSIRYQLSQWWVNSVLFIANICCGIKCEIEGLEHLPKNQAAVVLSKHQSAWETMALRQFLPQQVSLLKRSLLWIPFGGWALATLKPIAIDRENQRNALKTLLNQGSEALKSGLWVIIFPEGTRAASGEHKKFSVGGAMLAHKNACPVIPLAHNAGSVWPRYSFLKYPGIIKVKIGPAIKVEGKKAREINAEAEQWIRQAMNEIET